MVNNEQTVKNRFGNNIFSKKEIKGEVQGDSLGATMSNIRTNLYGHTQVTVAKHLNIAKNTYSDYENEKITIPLYQLVKFSDFYSLSLDVILDRKTENMGE